MMNNLQQTARERHALWSTLGDEGFRLFFLLTALHAALWPVLWVIGLGLEVPFSNTLPASVIHAHEMIIGSFGAALIGFITTAVPEWTDTNKLQHRALFVLAGLWGTARLIGIFAAEPLWLLAAICDVSWLSAVTSYLVVVSWKKRSSSLLGFVFWCVLLLASEIAARLALLHGNTDKTQLFIHIAGFAFLGLLGLALARITVAVTNRILDPTEETSPFRPHPGRRHLAPALIVVLIAGELAGFSEAVRGFLAIAAGAAFLDRVAEAFIGREALRAEIMVLAGSSALAGLGLCLLGAARLGAPFGEVSALHVTFMGGLGLGVLAVLSIAGLSHTGQALKLKTSTKIAFIFLLFGVTLRVAPELDLLPLSAGIAYQLSSVFWACAFLIWFYSYWPAFTDPTTIGKETC